VKGRRKGHGKLGKGRNGKVEGEGKLKRKGRGKIHQVWKKIDTYGHG